MNRANPKKAPMAAVYAQIAQQAKNGGSSSTLLTGSGGVDPGLLTLGKNSLLGQ